MSEIGTMRQLADDIAQGNLKLMVHRDKLDEALKGLQDYIDHLEGMAFLLREVEYVDGFGGFQMGIDLAQKFTRKGSGDGSIRERMKELVEELKAAQDVLRKAARAYAETDAAFADVLQGVQP